MNAPEKPMISVITAVYDGERFLRQTLTSVLSQTYTNFEHIIIDDGSIDSTPSILKEFAHLDSRIIIHRIENSGPATARNVALTMAKGEWIANLDADDICLPNRLEAQVRFMRRHPECVLLGSGCSEIDVGGNILKSHLYPSDHQRLVKHMERLGSFFPHSSMMYKKISGSNPVRYNPRFARCHDLDMCLKLAAAGRIACVSDILVRIRKHRDSISHDHSGALSTLMSFLVLICHFRRKAGLTDPGAMPQEEFEAFVPWLQRKMKENGIFRNKRAWETLRESFYAHKGNRLEKLVAIAPFLLKNPETLTGLQWRLAMSRQVGRLFEESKLRLQ